MEKGEIYMQYITALEVRALTCFTLSKVDFINSNIMVV